MLELLPSSLPQQVCAINTNVGYDDGIWNKRDIQL